MPCSVPVRISLSIGRRCNRSSVPYEAEVTTLSVTARFASMESVLPIFVFLLQTSRMH